MLRRRDGQSTAEYAIVLGVVVAAIIGMQLYIKRGMQGKFRQVTDHYTLVQQSGGVPLNGARVEQYEPYYATSTNLQTTQTVTGNDAMAAGGAFSKGNLQETTTRTGATGQGVNQGADDAWN